MKTVLITSPTLLSTSISTSVVFQTKLDKCTKEALLCTLQVGKSVPIVLAGSEGALQSTFETVDLIAKGVRLPSKQGSRVADDASRSAAWYPVLTDARG